MLLDFHAGAVVAVVDLYSPHIAAVLLSILVGFEGCDSLHIGVVVNSVYGYVESSVHRSSSFDFGEKSTIDLCRRSITKRNRDSSR